MKIPQILSWLVVTGLLAACAPRAGDVATPNPPTATESAATDVPPTALPPTPVLPTLTALPALSAEQLKNATYFAPNYRRQVTLKEGSFEEVGVLWVNLLTYIAFGDLNGDDLPDAAVFLAENGGGTGVFVSLVVVINQAGQPVQAGSVYIDDRPNIVGVEIVDGKIVVTAAIHGNNDPGCCPTLPVQQTYALQDGSPILIRQTSTSPSGALRAIYITSPLSGSLVGTPVQIQGDMPVAPFENNLVYRVYDLDFNELDAGPFGVTAADLGAPAQFDNLVSSPAFLPGTTLWFELMETSPADGTPLAIARIKLLIP